MKIALILITILIVGAAFLSLFNDGGRTLKEQDASNKENLDCVFDNLDDSIDECSRDDSEGTSYKPEVDIIEA